ncbi:MAG: P-loop NTPase fold protein [Candidatus Gracilibacteria bacterium]
MTNIPGFKFLKDAPIGKDTEGFFDFYHKNVAPALKTIIENDTCVHTIGLFGRWGTGKSTIIKLLKDEGITDSQVVEFDCWKYENDSLRRQLLLQIAKDLGISRKEIEKLEKDLYFSVSETVEEKVSISWAHLKKVGIISLAFLLPIGFFSWQLFPDIVHQWKLWIGTTLSMVLSIALLAEKILGDDLRKIIMISPITSSKAQLNSPEQFEHSFIKILKRADSKSKKIVIVIDNLDRVDSKVATEVLATLKTFLEIGDANLGGKQVIFLVPCDFEAIKKAAPSAELADEFLRKIFNVVLWTPEFINTDIRSFIADQIKQTGDISKFLDDEDVLLVIESAFANSPREIKQFINNLISSLIVAFKSEVKDIVEGNIAYMAKVLVLMHKYPVAFQNLKKSWYSPEEIVSTYDTVKINEEQEPFKEGFKSFMLSTSRITVSDAEPFIYLKKPVVSAQLKDAEGIRLGLIEGKETETKTLMQTETNKSALIEFVISVLNKYQNQPEILRNIFKTQLVIFQELGYTSKEYLNRVGTLLDSKVWPYFMELPTKIIFSFLLVQAQLDKNTIKNIVERYLISLSSTEEFKNFQKIDQLKIIVECLLANQDLLTTDQKNRFAQAIEQLYSGREDVVSLFVNAKNQKLLLTRKTLEQFIQTTNPENFPLRVEIFLGLKEIISGSKLFGVLTQKISELLTLLNTKTPAYSDEKENYLQQALKLINEFGNDLDQVGVKERPEFIRLAVQTFNNIGNWDQRATPMNILVFLEDIADQSQKTEIKNLLIQFLQNANPTVVKAFFDYWTVEYTQELIQEVFTHLQARIVSDQNFAKTIYAHANEVSRLQLISHLINNQHDTAIDFLNSLDIGEYNRVEAIKVLLTKAQGLGASERVRIYDFVSTKINDNDDTALKDIVAEQIKNLLNQDNDTNASVGFNFFTKADFLSKEKQREIVKSTLEFLRQAGKTITTNNRQAIKAIAHLFDILQETPKNDFVYLLFSLIKPDKSEDILKMVLENLNQIKPKFADYEKDFKDLYETLKSWNAENTQKIVSESILELRPTTRLSKDEKEYWDEIEKLSSENKGS